MRKADFCTCENKGADQLRSNCEADQRLCFRCTDSTIRLRYIAKLSSFHLSFLTVHAGLCRTGREPEDRCSCVAAQSVLEPWFR